MNSKSATIREIAEVAGVSPSTAFRALKEDRLVKSATRQKVLAAKRLLESERNHESRPIDINSLSVGIIMPASTAQDIGRHPSMFVTVTNFLSEFSGSNISNSVLVFDENTMKPEDLLAKPMDGYIIIGTSEDQENLLLPVLARANLPCVMINRHVNVPHISCVKFDDRSASADATRHLIALGHKKIAYLGGKMNYQHTKRRLEGYLLAMNEARLPVDEAWVIHGDYNETSGYMMGKAIEELPSRPTAAVCASDTIAIGCMHALQEKGISIPQDFSIVGFGDIESSRLINPPLTTIAQPSVDMGRVAAKALIQMIQMPVIVSQQTSLQTRLVIRESTDVPPTGK